MINRLSAAVGRDVSREAFEKLKCYAALVRDEGVHQNLVSAKDLDHIWERHILDSAQLVRFEPSSPASWVDVGAGAGFPGLVIACLVFGPVTLIEPRRLRADFLHRAAESLQIEPNILCSKSERVRGTFDVITARAVAALPRLFEISHHLSTRNSRWVLPKGRNAQSELADAQRAWQGRFHVEPSVTDSDSFIVIGTGVRAKDNDPHRSR